MPNTQPVKYQQLPVKLVHRGDTISMFASYPIKVAAIRENVKRGTVFITGTDGHGYDFTASQMVTVIEWAA